MSQTPKPELIVIPNRLQPSIKGQTLNQTPGIYFSEKPKKILGSYKKAALLMKVQGTELLKEEYEIFFKYLENFKNIQSKFLERREAQIQSKISSLQNLNTDIELESTKIKEIEIELEKTRNNKLARIFELKGKIAQEKNQLEFLRPKREALEKLSIEKSIDLQNIREIKQAAQAKLQNSIAERDKIKSLVLSQQEEIENLEIIKQSYAEEIDNLQRQRLQDYAEIKVLHNRLQELKGNIRVFCKIRPLLENEMEEPANIEIDRKLITIHKPDKANSFRFDRVFGPQVTIDELFGEISQLVQSALDGYKVCIFAYGQTGSGKTYTMEGPKDFMGISQGKGIIQKSVEQLFQSSEKLKLLGWNFNFQVSIIEIYNEQILDLLENSKKMTAFSVSMINPVYIDIYSYEDLYPLLTKARKQRSEAQTSCNAHSSRSHCLFQLKINGRKGIEEINGTLNLIDLAGSEKLKNSNAEGDRLEETKNINRSLSALRDVIQALVEKRGYIPFRNSKLTTILQNSLGGDGKTLMFVNISPLAINLQETIYSLLFAQKVNICSLPHQGIN
ncbi:unnamed protein product [Blepharisma stoltei]|uniref:Kinesin-like protein n=1 Tax=Blepharisma stoltei TaxID=1481888 RepID=A0AAU9JH86_9CILI|nr:unnamed protein product [Blepharisma stoltei]